MLLLTFYYPADIDLNDHTRAVSGAKEFFVTALSDFGKMSHFDNLKLTNNL